jgi:hypothetical protein
MTAAVPEFLMLPEVMWDVEDDLCDCTFQRIGMWTNPYLGETLEVRACCIWAKLYEMFPEYVRTTGAFLDYNRDEWDTTLRDWDGESDMPPAIWYRHLARKEGISVSEARAKYKHRDEERPRGVPRPQLEVEEEPDYLGSIFALLQGVCSRLDALEAKCP